MIPRKPFTKLAPVLTVVGCLALALVAPTPLVSPRAVADVPIAVPGVAPPDVPSLGYKDEDGNVISEPGTVAALWACTPLSSPDYPHYSSGDVSGHGQWDKGTCKNNLADVYNCLYDYYTDGYWYRKACSPKVRLKPKSISNNRTTARATCANTLHASWRNHVDVDVVDESDTADRPYKQQNVACQVF